MAPTALPNIITSIANGMATLTGLSATQVSSSSWQIAGNAVSCFVAPAFSGSQGVAAMGGKWDLVDRVLVEFTFRPIPNLAAMYNNAATMLERARLWFRSNNTLAGSVATCHAEPLTWQAIELRQPPDEIVYKTVTFTVAVGQYV